MNRFIKEYFVLFLVAAMAAGYLFSPVFLPINRLTIPILGGLMISSFLSADFHLFLARIRRPGDVLLVFLLIKLVLPAALYFLLRPWNELLAVAVLLMTAAPSAAVSPALTTLCRGDAEFILVLLIFTTLVSPVSLPLTMNFLAGADMEIDIPGMIRTLLQIIIFPLVLSLILKQFLKEKIEKVKPWLGSVSVILLTVLLLGLVAGGAGAIREHLGLMPLYGSVALVLGLFLALGGFFFFPFFDRGRRVGLSIATLYVNVGLVIVLSVRYFPVEVMIFCLLYEVPVNIIPGIIRRLNTRPS